VRAGDGLALGGVVAAAFLSGLAGGALAGAGGAGSA